MKIETRVILTAFRNFLARDEVQDKTLTAVMPVDAKLGDLSGKPVDIPLNSVFQGLFHKIGFKDMARILDDNNDVVVVFLDELSRQLKGYSRVNAGVPLVTRSREVDAVADIIDDEITDNYEEGNIDGSESE